MFCIVICLTSSSREGCGGASTADVLKADMIVEIGWVEMKFVFEESVTAAAATAPQNYVHEKVS